VGWVDGLGLEGSWMGGVEVCPLGTNNPPTPGLQRPLASSCQLSDAITRATSHPTPNPTPTHDRCNPQPQPQTGQGHGRPSAGAQVQVGSRAGGIVRRGAAVQRHAAGRPVLRAQHAVGGWGLAVEGSAGAFGVLLVRWRVPAAAANQSAE